MSFIEKLSACTVRIWFDRYMATERTILKSKMRSTNSLHLLSSFLEVLRSTGVRIFLREPFPNVVIRYK